ncbi:cell division protein FtsA [Alkalicaulis satelles]|uniref:Cell division protein FtsA n=2 Tax=Alkalicaulis satelles TaxID=2609175 RepID=A0A5M6ZL00_9PROT|nr:cell division protein FtsA [Alkalicaulis satelles]
MGMFGAAGGESAGARKPALYAALDLGASKTVCFIARTEPTLAGLRPRVIGVGHVPTRGVRAGAVVDMEAAASAIRAAVDNAERMAGQTVSALHVAAACGAPSSTRIAVDMELDQREVRERDLRRIIHEAASAFDEPGRAIVHALALSWRVDGHRGVKDPRAMVGEVLGVDLHLVSCAADPLHNLAACVERAGYSVAGVTATPYASGLAALTADELELGVMVIDMGAQLTTLSIFAEGVLQHVDALPVGGAHVTSDIARGLSTPLAAAERIKALSGSALDSPEDDQVMIEAPPLAGGASHTMTQHPRAMLNAIIRPRLEEIFELARDRVKTAGAAGAAGRGLVLTGGASQTPGITQLAGRVMSKQVRIGRPETLNGLGDAVSGPAFSAGAGLILRAVNGPPEALAGLPRALTPAPRGRKAAAPAERGPAAVWRWFAESF